MKRKVATRKATATRATKAAAPSTPREKFAESWSYSPNEQDESLEVGDQGSFRFVKEGSEMQMVHDPALVVERILQCSLERSHWHRFAAFLPTLYPPDGEHTLTITVQFGGGAAAALRTMAGLRGMTVDQVVRTAMANDTACWLADSNAQETPEYATLFGVEEEATT